MTKDLGYREWQSAEQPAGDDTARVALAAREALWGSPGMVAVRAELAGPDDGPDRYPALAVAYDMVVDIAALEPGLARVLADIVRQMEESPYTDGRPVTRLLPLLAEFATRGSGS